MAYNKKLYKSDDSVVDSSVIYDDNLSKLQSEINSDLHNSIDLIIVEYNNSKTYVVGEYCRYSGKIYKCISNISTAENWNPEHWVETTVGNELKSMNEDLTAFNIIHVNIDGSGDYTSISDAVNAATTNDVIIIHPGVYFESVHAYNKLVHIKGVNKKTCILEYHGRNYSTPPLEMAKGSVENLTIIARDSGSTGNASAYCVHIDNDNEAEQSLSFKNVSFINEIHQAVGIGLRHNFDLRFENCEFEAVNQAALYCHDWETSDTSADKSGQKLTLHNCTLQNNDSEHATIMLQSQELATNCALFEIVGCAIYNANASGKNISMTKWQGRTLTNNSFLGSSDWVLDAVSSLNTEPLINSEKDYVIEEYVFSISEGMPAGAIGRRASQVSIADRHSDLSIVGIQIVNIQASSDYIPVVFFSSGKVYCNYYATTTSGSSATQVVARLTYK